jgi:hypothetical protein
VLVDEFDPTRWLAEVGRARPDSLDLFVLAAWGDAGNDTRPIVEALMVPGEKRQYPHLSQVAAMIQDGGVLASGGTQEIIELAEAAVRRVADPPGPRQLEVSQRPTPRPAYPTTPAVREVLRAILQRTRDATRVVRLIGDDLLSVRKRAEAGRVLSTSENQADRDVGLAELIRLAYEADLSDDERLEVLSVIVEVAPRHERRHAIQRLAQFVETAHHLSVRMEAMDILRRANEASAAAAALLRRALDVQRPVEEREDAGFLFLFYLHDNRSGRVSSDDIDSPDQFEEKTWRATVSRPVQGDPFIETAVLGMIASYSEAMGISAMGRYIRSRPIDWNSRSALAAVPASTGWTPSGREVPVAPTEPIAWQAVALLASDGEESWPRRIDLLVNYARRVPGRTDDVSAQLDRWMRMRHASMKERRGVLSALSAFVDADGLRAITLDAGLPVTLRMQSAVEHGLRTGRSDLLTMLSSAFDASGWEKVKILFWRRIMPLLIRLDRS